MNSKRRVLVCDDEPQILRALRLVLRDGGFDVITATTVKEALDIAALHNPEAAIIDLLLPDGDGVEICERIREWSEMPIIVLSAVGDESDKVRALNSGADDYITKPFSPAELTARINAVLRRVDSVAGEPIIKINGLEVDLDAHEVRRGKDVIHLTKTEFELLKTLLANRGRLMTHAALLNTVWGPSYESDTQVLRVHIANLRRKVEQPGKHLIRTDPGIGYRIVA